MGKTEIIKKVSDFAETLKSEAKNEKVGIMIFVTEETQNGQDMQFACILGSGLQNAKSITRAAQDKRVSLLFAKGIEMAKKIRAYKNKNKNIIKQ